MKVSELNSIYPVTCPIVLSIREQYADWNAGLEKGYIRYNLNSAILYEHKLSAEVVHGPKPDGYECHHIDHRRSNNDPMNLVYLSPDQHRRAHSCRSMRFCNKCGAEIWIGPSRRKRLENVYCNRSCAKSVERRGEWPTAKELAAEIVETQNWLELGRRYGVSDNAMRKRAKKLGVFHLYISPHKRTG